MDAPANDLLEMARNHFNEPMLAFLEVVRCVGYGEDDCDAYIIVRYPRPYPNLVWLTCVGGYTFLDRLKGQGHVKARNGEDWDDLTRLDNWLNLNGAPRAEEFMVELRPDTTPSLGGG